MKTRFSKSGWLLLLIIVASGYYNNGIMAQSPVSGTITYQTFYDNLSPYGTWIDYPGYGHVWNPHIDGDFRPYATNGNWSYTDEGWTWASNYNWGWAPFHYGRWFYDDLYGWLWVPGNEWSPAWVTWGSADGFYCWAPLMPDVNVSIAFNSWRPPNFYWNVCSREHIYDHNLILERPERVTGIAKNITIINNFKVTHTHGLHYALGPDINEVGRYAKQTIKPMPIKEVLKAGPIKQNANAMAIYRPRIQHPQPQEFRKVETDKLKPIRTNDDLPSFKASDQRSNVERLSVRKENIQQPRNFRDNVTGRR